MALQSNLDIGGYMDGDGYFDHYFSKLPFMYL